MVGRSRMAVAREQAATASGLAAQLVRDKKFRKKLIGAARHGSRAKRRMDRQIGLRSLVARLASDPKLRAEVQQMTGDLQSAWERLEVQRTRRSHGLRNSLLLAGFGGGVALVLRKRGGSMPSFSGGTTPRVIESSIE